MLFQLNWRQDVLWYQTFCLGNIHLFFHNNNVFQNHFGVCGIVCGVKPIYKHSYAWVDPIRCCLGHSWIPFYSTIKRATYINRRGIRELHIRRIRRRGILTVRNATMNLDMGGIKECDDSFVTPKFWLRRGIYITNNKITKSRKTTIHYMNLI